MIKREKLYPAVFMLFACGSVLGQSLLIKGRVRDANTHQDIPAVNVFIANTSIGATTDFSGKFTLSAPESLASRRILLRHVAFENADFPINDFRSARIIYLRPKLLFIKGVEVTAQGRPSTLVKDLPQTTTILNEESFAMRGYVDAGDFLRTEQSVQVSEEMNGRKTVTLRGGNADEVLVLYNGVRLNNLLDQSFDFSLIDPDGVERFEVVKGSHATLYGSGALSGLINIVPKTRMDHRIRFQQCVGSYDAGQWGVSLYYPVNRWHPAYSYKTGAHRRLFSSTTTPYALINRSTQQQATLALDLNPSGQVQPDRGLEVVVMQSKLYYENQRDVEKLDQDTRLASVSYHGLLGPVGQTAVSAAYNQSLEQQSFYVNYSRLRRHLDNQGYLFRAEKQLNSGPIDLLAAYQWDDNELRWQEDALVGRAIDVRLHRQQHGLAAIIKFHGDSGSALMPVIDFDLSIRHDYVMDDRRFENSTLLFDRPQQTWRATPVNLGLSGVSRKGEMVVTSRFNYGHNAKFPTLMQQMSLPVLSALSATSTEWQPERINSTEIGLEILRNVSGHDQIRGWQFVATWFKHYYRNKMRPLYSVGVPIVYYDYVNTATLSGIELAQSVFLLEKKVKVDGGFVHYSFSDQAVFPFKFTNKYYIDVNVNHAGFSLQTHLYQESEQLGLIRQGLGKIIEVSLPGYSDLDIHVGKTVPVSHFTVLLRAAIFNVLNKQTQLLGLALRDRRYMVTAALQY
jgi:outer membrane receptor protein involved in Fe transport